jgi:hypothetical protein
MRASVENPSLRDFRLTGRVAVRIVRSGESQRHFLIDMSIDYDIIE